MKRTWTLLGIGLALALPLTACTRDKAPDAVSYTHLTLPTIRLV